MNDERRTFMCNTDRRESLDLGHAVDHLELLMKTNSCAMAWGKHNWVDHTDSVQKGDLILMWAKGVGFIGLGEALAASKVLGPTKKGRLFKELDVDEWQIPVKWLAWVPEFEAWPWTPPNCTFLDMNKERYRHVREAAINHLLEKGSIVVSPEAHRQEEE